MDKPRQSDLSPPPAMASGVLPPWVLLVFLHLVMIMWGIHSGADTRATMIDVAFPLSAGIIAVMTCVNDAKFRRAPLPRGVQFVMLFLWPVLVPVYLIGTRGWRGILWALLWTATVYSCYLFPAAYFYMLRLNHR
jgi:hypothetical protein